VLLFTATLQFLTGAIKTIIMNLEEKLKQDLNSNHQIVHIMSVDGLISEWKDRKGHSNFKQGSNKAISKRKAISNNPTLSNRENWKFATSLAAPTVDAITITKLLKDFGLAPDKLRIKTYGGKKYIIFKGLPGNRKVFKGTRYLLSNPKVISMGISPKGIAKSVKLGALITVVSSVGLEAYYHFIKDETTLSYFLGTVTGDLVKIGLSAIASVAAGIAVGGLAVVGTSVAIPLIAAVFVGFVVGSILDKVDERFGITEALIKTYKQIGIKLAEMEYEMNQFERATRKNPEILFCLFGPCDGHGNFGGF
jgi:hypothetical protein